MKKYDFDAIKAKVDIFEVIVRHVNLKRSAMCGKASARSTMTILPVSWFTMTAIIASDAARMVM